MRLRKEGDANRVSPQACGRVCVHSTPSARGVHISQCFGDRVPSLDLSLSSLPLQAIGDHVQYTTNENTLSDEASRTNMCPLSASRSPSVFTMTMFVVVFLASEFMVPRGCMRQNRSHRNSSGLLLKESFHLYTDDKL